MEKLFAMSEYDYQTFFKLYEETVGSSVGRFKNLGDLMKLCHKHNITAEELTNIRNMINKYGVAIFGSNNYQ